MPFVDEFNGFRPPAGVTPAPEVAPASEDTIGAAFQQGNTLVSGLHFLNLPRFAAEDGYNPVDDLKVRRPDLFYSHGDRFTGSTSSKQSDQIISEIEREDANNRTLVASGWAGTIAGLGAGALDPTMFLPMGAVAKGGLATADALMTARSVAKLALLQSTAQEALLSGTQQTRTLSESAANIGSATILGGLLGAAGHALLAREGLAEKGAADLDVARARLSEHNGVAEPAASAPGVTGEAVPGAAANSNLQPPEPAAQSVGAAVADTGQAMAGDMDDLRPRRNLRDPSGFVSATPKAFDVEETRALKNYKGMGEEINTFLRTGEEKASRARIDEAVAGLDRAFARSSLNETTNVYRGVTDGPYADLTDADAGKTITEKSFLSTSLLDDEAENFTQLKHHKANKPALLDIEMPKGMPAINMDAMPPHDAFASEILFPRGLQFEVRGVYYTNGSKVPTVQLRGILPVSEAEARGSGQAMAAGAAVADTRDLSPTPYGLDSIPGVGKAVSKIFPNLDVLTNGVDAAKRAVTELAEVPLSLKANVEGQTATRYGGPAIDREIKLVREGMHAQADDVMMQQWSSYLEGQGGQKPGVMQRMTGNAGEGRMTFDAFDAAVYDALSTGDQHPIPQVAAAAQWMRKNGFDPVKERAAAIDGFSETKLREGETYAPRLWNKDKISAQWNDYVGMWTDHLQGEQMRKAQLQQQISAYHGAMESHAANIDKLEAKIERRSIALDDIEARQEEVRRFNEFAYKRSSKMSAPLDDLRDSIRNIEAKIQPHLDRLGEFREHIRTEKEQFPQIREADALIFKMIGSAQKLKQSKSIIEFVDNASEYTDALDEVIGGFKGGIRAASDQAKAARRELGADTLVGLEKAQADLRKEISPYTKQLTKLRRELRDENAARLPNARGGAVFETQIRQRGNTLADRASGKDAEIGVLQRQLAAETQSHDAMRAKIEDSIEKWGGKSAREAVRALAAREEAAAERAAAMEAGTSKSTGERLTSADRAVDRAAKSIIGSDRTLDRQELRSRAEEIASRQIGTPDGRLPYDSAETHGEGGPGGSELRGHAARREIDLPYDIAKPWLDRSATQALKSYTHSVLPDAIIAERFDGDPAMTSVMKEIESSYAAKRAAAGDSEAAQNKLKAAMDNDIRIVAGMRDRIRGTYANDPQMRSLARLSQNALKINNIISSHGMAVASLPDFAGVVFRNGFEGAFRDAWLPFFNSLIDKEGWQAVKAAGQEWKAFGIGIETQSASRNHALSDINENYRPTSKFERALSWVSDKAFLANLLAPLTDIQKRMATNAVSHNIIRMSQAVAEGKATAKDVQRLAEGNITEAQAAKIWDQFSNNGGASVKGILLPNTAGWTDAAAKRAFVGAVARDVDIAVVQPGQEKPFFMSKPGYNVLGQYKAFSFASTQRILIANLQRRDAASLSGLITAVGMGMLSYRINTMASGQPVSERPQDWIKEGISRGGILGVLDDANNFAAKATGGKADLHRLYGADKPLTKFVNRDAASMFLGPTYGKVQSLMQVSRAATNPSTWGESDTHALRMATLGTNFPYLPRLFDQVEIGVNHALGIPMKAKN